MVNRGRASKLRQQIPALAAELAALQAQMLRPQRMMAASLIERHLGTRRRKRRSSAFYLSCSEAGQNRLTYVPKKDLKRLRRQVDAWRAYRLALRRWRQSARELAGLFDELGRAQARRPQRERRP